MSTYDDVLIKPRFSEIESRRDVDLTSQLTPNIKLTLPIISANMDSITEAAMAIAMAKNGGLGVIHRYCTIEEQVEMVRQVKRYTNYIIREPYTVDFDTPMTQFDNVSKIQSYLVMKNNELIGILTNRDVLAYKITEGSDYTVGDFATTDLVCVSMEVAQNPSELLKMFREHKFEQFPVLEDNELKGLITLKDILYRMSDGQTFTLDSKSRLAVAAAVGITGDFLDRAKALVTAGVDALVVDVAHGHHILCGKAVHELSTLFDVDIIAGNVCTADGVRYLAKCGAKCVKVGIGPGSICITRKQTGCGYPQLSAVQECAKAAKECKVTIIADGGHQGASGNIFKAICAGAAASMLGGMLSGTDETPGDIIVKDGKKVKMIRGMAGRMSNLRRGVKITTPEGVEGYVSAKGPVADVLEQIKHGVQSGFSYVGCRNIAELRKNPVKFVKISGASKRESGAHDITEI